MTELETITAALAASGGGAVLATLVRVDGSAYRGPGARMVVLADGRAIGAISGGCLEQDVRAHAEQVRAAGRPRLVSYDLTRDDDAPWGLGMGCNARLDVLLEPCPGGVPAWIADLNAAQARREAVVLATRYEGEPLGKRALRVLPDGVSDRTRAAEGVLHEYLPPPIAVVACGDGPDTAPLVDLATALGWHARAVGKDAHLGALDPRSAAVVMTHHYARDLALLEELLPSSAGYVGVLGPRARTERLLADARASGVHVGDQARARLHAPVGLDIGAETPQEIALAIAAEVRAVFAGREGGPLAHRAGPIHAR